MKVRKYGDIYIMKIHCLHYLVLRSKLMTKITEIRKVCLIQIKMIKVNGNNAFLAKYIVNRSIRNSTYSMFETMVCQNHNFDSDN